MFLFADYREKWFFDYLEQDNSNSLLKEYKPFIKSAPLPIGDFIICEDEEMTSILTIIERKTIRDLSSSITDGRFREQKERLLDSVKDESKILYIIEGNQKILKNGVSGTIIDSSIINLLFKHHFKVLKTDNSTDTFNNLMLLLKKFENNEFNQVTITAPVKLVSKKDKINGNLLATQLSVISGLSYKTAKIISENYTSLKMLIHEYDKCENIESMEKMLSNIQLSDSRKLGNALSKKIYNCLYNNN